ncbi:MAG: LytR/AlgR family response regulator transcription factor [Anaerolineae bacterium]
MHILLADDETPAREELRFILEDLIPGAVFHEAENGRQAVAMVEKETIDVAFLDIHMPELDGLGAAAEIMGGPSPPLVIFATAYDAHAIEAFEVAALDYVVKPFDERRLERTAERIRWTLAEHSEAAKSRAALQEFIAARIPQAGLTRLWGEGRDEARVLVDFADILWLEARSKRVHMHTTRGQELLVRRPLKDLERQLEPRGFARVHRSYIVNLDHVAELHPWFSGSWVLRMDDERRSEIPMSRRYAPRLKQRLDWG